MRVDCEHCGKALQVPDDKVPEGAFTLTCPGCRETIRVDPKQSPAPGPARAEASAREPVQRPTQPAPQTPPGEHDVEHDGEMRSLRGHEVELLESLSPVAFAVHLDGDGGGNHSTLNAQLKTLGMKEIRHFADLGEACERAEEAEAGILLVRMQKAPAPPCEPLEPIYQMPFKARRRTFVALVADNVRTLDGQVAFYLQMNCLIHAGELPRLAVPLRRALLHDLKLYRHWWTTIESN